MLKIDPQKRIHPSHAKMHPFIQTLKSTGSSQTAPVKTSLSLVMDENVTLIQNVVSQTINEEELSDHQNFNIQTFTPNIVNYFDQVYINFKFMFLIRKIIVKNQIIC